MMLLLTPRLSIVHKDYVRLTHMLDSTNAALSFIKGRSKQDLESDRQLLSAVTRELEILGEAANNTSKDTQAQITEIPWRTLIGMRNRLIHAYFDINTNIIWTTPQDVLPNFKLTLEQAIREFKIV